jgi:hypothetical protein
MTLPNSAIQTNMTKKYVQPSQGAMILATPLGVSHDIPTNIPANIPMVNSFLNHSWFKTQT